MTSRGIQLIVAKRGSDATATEGGYDVSVASYKGTKGRSKCPKGEMSVGSMLTKGTFAYWRWFGSQRAKHMTLGSERSGSGGLGVGSFAKGIQDLAAKGDHNEQCFVRWSGRCTNDSKRRSQK